MSLYINFITFKTTPYYPSTTKPKLMLKILLVDDDSDEFDLFTSAIKSLNSDADLIYANKCDDLSGIIKNQKPDIVFMDINMPGFDGIECLKTLRLEKGIESLPIIMYSTSKNQRKIEESYQHKANLYVVKPYSYQGLVKALEKVLIIDWNLKPVIPLSNFVIRNIS